MDAERIRLIKNFEQHDRYLHMPDHEAPTCKQRRFLEVRGLWDELHPPLSKRDACRMIGAVLAMERFNRRQNQL